MFLKNLLALEPGNKSSLLDITELWWPLYVWMLKSAFATDFIHFDCYGLQKEAWVIRKIETLETRW